MDNTLLCTEGKMRIPEEIFKAKSFNGYKIDIFIHSNEIGLIYGNTKAQCKANAERIVTAWNSHGKLINSLSLMTYLVKLKYGNLDKDVYDKIVEAETLLNELAKSLKP